MPWSQVADCTETKVQIHAIGGINQRNLKLEWRSNFKPCLTIKRWNIAARTRINSFKFSETLTEPLPSSEQGSGSWARVVPVSFICNNLTVVYNVPWHCDEQPKVSLLLYALQALVTCTDAPSQEEIASIKNQYTKDTIFYTDPIETVEVKE